MASRLLALILTFAPVVTFSSGAHAQPKAPLSVAVTAAREFGRTRGEYHGDRNGLAADVLLALRLRPTAGGVLVVGLGASSQAARSYATICTPMANGECMPHFPGFSTLAPSVGWETNGAFVRGMVGPTLVWPDAGRPVVGVQGRLDMMPVTVGRVSGIVSVRHTLIPDYRGDMVGLLAIGAGLRLH